MKGRKPVQKAPRGVPELRSCGVLSQHACVVRSCAVSRTAYGQPGEPAAALRERSQAAVPKTPHAHN